MSRLLLWRHGRTAWNHERHAFLLRLGVWEVLPIEAFEGRSLRAR